MSFRDVYGWEEVKESKACSGRHPEFRLGHQRRTGYVHTLLISTTILFTSISAVGLGVAMGYTAIWAILSAFGRHPRPEPARVPAEPATVTSR